MIAISKMTLTWSGRLLNWWISYTTMNADYRTHLNAMWSGDGRR